MTKSLYRCRIAITVLAFCSVLSLLIRVHGEPSLDTVNAAPLTAPQSTPTPVVFPDANTEFIIGPQVKVGSSWFDTNEVARALVHGGQCPDTPPTDPEALNTFILLNYYDLPMVEYVTYYRTGDSAYLTLARKCADAWWKHPDWIGQGSIRQWPNSATPPPRHAGVGGLILRAMDGHPEMWDWINSYTRYSFDLWLKTRINNSSLYYGLREGAFALHYAVWLAKVLPDTFPLQSGGTVTNGATLRAQYLADVEAQVLNYFARLQFADGSWRWDDPDFIDSDGGKLVGIMQPFMVGMLLTALIDVHRLSTNSVVKTSIQTQLTKACTHLFNVTYRRTEDTGIAGVKWRSFWYAYHGGTTVNPTKYANGGGSYVAPAQAWQVKSERQLTGTIFAAYAYAYTLTGDSQYLTMGNELIDSAFVGTDGIRNEADGTAKNFNQNYRMGARYFAWVSGSVAPSPSPTPTVAITGSVTLSGTPLTSVVVQLLRSPDRVKLGESTTGVSGTYSLNPAYGSSVIVQPVRSGYSFNPSEVLVSPILSNKTQNFAATAPSPTPIPTATVTPTPTPTPGTDITRPVVTLTSPVSGVVTTSPVTVDVIATDNVGIDSVYLLVDGAVMGVDRSAPYSFAVTLADGAHSVFVRAWDAAANAGDSATITVNVTSVVPTPTPTPTPSPTPRPLCEPNQLQNTGCRCTTRWYRNPKRCKP